MNRNSSRMSAWNRNQTTSFRPPNMAPFRNNNGGSSTHGSSQATVPDISIRNHRQWKSAFERVLAEYLTRGIHGADQLNAIVKQAINDRLNAEPDSQTFKSLQLVTDVITALSIGQENGKELPGPVAFAKSEVTRGQLASLTNLGSGRIFTRGIYRLFPLDHDGATSDTEFQVFLLRRGINIWPVAQQNDSEGGHHHHRRAQTPSRAGPSGDLTTATKRQFDGQGASHYSPPAQRKRPPMPTRDWTIVDGSNQLTSQALDFSEDGSLPLRPNQGHVVAASASGVSDYDSFGMSRRPSSSGFTVPAVLPSDKETALPAAAAAAGGAAGPATAPAGVAVAASPAPSLVAPMDKATIDNDNVNEIIKTFTRDLTERQKDLVALRARVAELETGLSDRDAEIAALKAGADGETRERFAEEKAALARDQNKLALDRARFAAQASTWAEKLGQVQSGLGQYLPARVVKEEDEVVEGEEEGA